jgi:hypothetical protein
MSGKGDADTRVKDRAAYNENFDRIFKNSKTVYCKHHVPDSMHCEKCAIVSTPKLQEQ